MSNPRTDSFRALVACAASALLLAGCASSTFIESRHMTEEAAASPGSDEGITYFLPKRLLQLSVWAYVHVANESVLGKDGTPELRSDGSPMTTTTRSLRHFATYDGDFTVPDTSREFRLVVNHSMLSDDDIQVTVSEEGFLKSVTGKTKDKTKDIAGDLATLAGQLMQVGPAFESYEPTRDLTDAFAPSTPRLVARYDLDPTDAADLGRVQGEFRNFGVSLGIERHTGGSLEGAAGLAEHGRPGVCYRLALPYRISLSPAGIVEPKPGRRQSGLLANQQVVGIQAKSDFTVLLPNEAPNRVFPVTRTAFVEQRTELEFTNGTLTSVTSSKPSELQGFVEIPVTALEKVVQIPSDLLSLRIKRQNEETQLTNAETAAATAEKRRLEAMQQLLDAMDEYQRANSPNTRGNPRPIQ